jgi:ATP-binding cassette subfamily B protein/ATP-binding cassette subfamily C protein LapB
MRQSLLLFLRKNRRHVAEMLLASVLVNLFMLALPLFSMLVYDKAIGNQVHDTLWALATGMGLLLALELVMRSARIYLIEHAGARWDAFLDERVVRGVLAAPLSRPLAPADLLNRMREVAATREVLSAQSLLAAADLPFVLLFAAVVAAVGGALVWIPLGMGALVLATGAVFQRAGLRRQREATAAGRAKLGTLMDLVAARESLHGRPLARVAESTYRHQAQTGARAAAKARWWAQLQQQTMPVLIAATSVAMMVGGVFQIEAQALSVGGLISVNMLGIRLLSSLCSAAPLAGRWREFTRALDSLGQSVDLQAPPLVDPAVQDSALAQEGIRLEDLHFAWTPQGRPVLDGLNLQLRPQQIVALVGASGAGKSTLLRLLAGQLQHTGGRLVFGAHVVGDEASRQWMCRQVQHKPQDPCFLGGTLAEVVAAGQPGATDAALVDALRRAGLGPALDRGDLGLNTPVGTNGAGLSGGQRQMVALATAFHADLPVLLLDEPTLGLDRSAQERVLEALPALREGRCVVIATHAAEVIQRADRVLVLDRGRVVADGPPDRLLAAAAHATARGAAARAAHVAPVRAVPDEVGAA